VASEAAKSGLRSAVQLSRRISRRGKHNFLFISALLCNQQPVVSLPITTAGERLVLLQGVVFATSIIIVQTSIVSL
jgi:hypothetical protein